MHPTACLSHPYHQSTKSYHMTFCYVIKVVPWPHTTFETLNTSQPTIPAYTFQPKLGRGSSLPPEFLTCVSLASYFGAPSEHTFLQKFLMTKLQADTVLHKHMVIVSSPGGHQT